MRKNEERPDHYFSDHPKSQLKLGIIHTYLRGTSFKFLTASGVFSRKRLDLGTRLLIESMLLPEDGQVLDIGSGYGAVGIVAAALNPKLHVIMVDVNERAVWLAKQNLKLNNVDNAEVRKGYLYKPVESFTFNCILSNPPVSAGMTTVKAIIAEAPEHMVIGATFQMVIRSKIWGKRLCTIFEKSFGNVTVSAIKSGYRVLMAKKQ